MASPERMCVESVPPMAAQITESTDQEEIIMYSEKFAKQLKELIGSRSISSVAKEIGIPQATLSRYILCQREIGIENLCKIANYFNEDLDILTGRKEF